MKTKNWAALKNQNGKNLFRHNALVICSTPPLPWQITSALQTVFFTFKWLTQILKSFQNISELSFILVLLHGKTWAALKNQNGKNHNSLDIVVTIPASVQPSVISAQESPWQSPTAQLWSPPRIDGPPSGRANCFGAFVRGAVTPLSSGLIFQPSSVQSANKTLCFPSALSPLPQKTVEI